MTRYLISFDAHAMDHIPDEEGSAVGKASHAVSVKAGQAQCCLRPSPDGRDSAMGH
jgi:hypothetical protein